MPSDVRLTHAHRLPAPSHSISPYNRANLPSQPFTVNAASGPSSHRVSTVALDDVGDAQSSGHASSYARGGGGSSWSDAFPSTFADQGILARQKRDALERALEARGAGPGAGSSKSNTWGGDDAWSWDDEHIYIRPSLLPLPSSQLGAADDPLPSEQHSSYPLGRPIEPRSTSIHPRASLSHHVQTSRVFLAEAAAWNSGTGQGNEGGPAAATGVQPASVPATGGAEAAAAAAEGGGEALWKPLTGLPAYLASLKAAAVAASTTTQQGGRTTGGSSGARQAHASGCWPFVNFGPGASLVRRRDEDDWDDANAGPGTAAAAAKEVWLEHDFEKLLPLGRERDPLEYLNAGLLRQASSVAGQTGAQSTSGAVATNTATDEASSYLDRVETEMAQRVASQLKVAAGAEVHKEESEASQQLRSLLAAGSTPTLPALAPPLDNPPMRARPDHVHQQQREQQPQQQPQQQQRPLPALLLDRFGGQAEELRALLSASASSAAAPPKRNERGGWEWADVLDARGRAEDSGGSGAESEWLRRARRAREEEERARMEELVMSQAATAT